MASRTKLTIKIPKTKHPHETVLKFIKQYNSEKELQLKPIKHLKCNSLDKVDCYIILAKENDTKVVVKMREVDEWHEYVISNLMIEHKLLNDHILIPLKTEVVDGIGFIFYKYYKNSDLFYFLDDLHPKRPSEAIIKKLALDILTALKYLNDHNLVHRDVKPENIFLADNGVDFILGDHEFISSPFISKRIQGTDKYISPEAFKDGVVTYNGDIWSLGMMLYWCLSYNFCKINNDKTPDLKYLKELVSSMIISPACYDFISECLVYDYMNRKVASELLTHEWLMVKKKVRGIKRKIDFV